MYNTIERLFREMDDERRSPRMVRFLLFVLAAKCARRMGTRKGFALFVHYCRTSFKVRNADAWMLSAWTDGRAFATRCSIHRAAGYVA